MGSVPIGANGVRAQVEAFRSKLLDLSLRNKMLNYRPSKRLGITIVGESSLEVHRILVEEGKKMSFVGKKDPPAKRQVELDLYGYDDDVVLDQLRRDAEDELDAYIGNRAMPVQQMDTKLETDDFESVLQAKLTSIQREASLSNDELGINTLFLALGFLEWTDPVAGSVNAPLIFVPVRLDRLSNGSMRVVHDGSDVGENLPLRAKMAEFNIKLPTLDEEDKTLLDYLNEVESTVRGREDWAVHRNEIRLGFFNYEKYAMYIDLGGENWPDDQKPWMHTEITSLLATGYASPKTDIDDSTFIDDVRPVNACHEVYDADSSQSLAMLRASEGLSIVVEGPPGTGKSQTITNIIAEAVADGKTVLFVSAKRAALDVVKRRLEEAELGDMCLDLHNRLTNRREFYAEIKRVAGRALTLRDEEQRVQRMTELREKLNEHSRAVNTPVTGFAVTPFEAMCTLARLPKETPEDRDGRIPFESLRQLNSGDIESHLPHIRALQARLATTGTPAEHPFWRTEIAYLDPGIKLDLEQELGPAIEDLEAALTAFKACSSALKVDVPATADDVRVLKLCCDRVAASPSHDGVAVLESSWRTEEAAVRELATALETRNRLMVSRSGQVLPSIWAADLAEVSKEFENWSEKWFRFTSGGFRHASKALQGHFASGGPKEAPAQRDLIRDVLTVQSCDELLASRHDMMLRLFGVQWQGANTDPALVIHLLDWVLALRTEVEERRVPEGLLSFFAGGGEPSSLPELVRLAELASEKAVLSLTGVLDILAYPQDDLRSRTFGECLIQAKGWQDNLHRLPEYIALNEVRRQIVNRGLEPVVRLADLWPLAKDRLEHSFLRSYYSGVVREAMASRPALRTFEREMHEAAIAEFRTLDDFTLRYNRARVRLAHQRQMPTFDVAAGNLHLLKLQCELQRKHKPIRWTLARAGEAVQRIKPVFMMSPLSVAIHLPPELPQFDMVVFDEASQVKPEDALCAIVRAKQVIVVGDTRQMPPTSFFDRLNDDEDISEDLDEAGTLSQEAKKLESVLNLMSAVTLGRARRPDLRWHYRSLHPSLIQPSNEMFYENRLVIFPSPSTNQQGRRTGVEFHHLKDTVYEGGAKRRVNRKEAETVADAVVLHLKEHADESLMVAAMNKPQADLIFAELVKRERHDPQLFADFRALHPHEPLDVKNLENVQGDERDVVFISVTYGRDENGVLRQQFGPLLQEGGERRLNVLITRARLRCAVFSNIVADDLRVEATTGGVHALKQYLRFAQEAHPVTSALGIEDAETPFEQDVTTALRERGYEVVAEVGTEGCRIDLAVLDPREPGRLLLGVTCDGPSYGCSRSARDRDKLRHRVLESRGWCLHRIWSNDWWQDREGEIERLLRAIDSALTPAKPIPPKPVLPVEQFVVEAPPVVASKLAVARPYTVATAPTEPLNQPQLAEYLLQVVAAEGPIARDLLVQRLREATGLTKVGQAKRFWLEQYILYASDAGRIRALKGAYFMTDSQIRQPRDWSNRPTKERKFDLVPQIEVEAALHSVIELACGVSADEAVKCAVSLLGFRRIESVLARGAHVLAEMLAVGSVVERNGLLFVL